MNMIGQWKRLTKKYVDERRSAGWADATMIATTRWLKKFMLWCGADQELSPVQVTAADIERYRQFLLCTRTSSATFYTLRTVDQALRVLRQFFDWATTQGHLLINPAQDLVLPRIETRIQEWTVEDVQRLLEVAENGGTAAGLRDRALLEVFYRAGVRRRECMGLRMSDLNLEDRQLRVVDLAGQERQVPVEDALAATLERYLRDSRPVMAAEGEEALFVTAAGTPYSEGCLAQMVRRLGERAGRRATAHVLRHACAVHMMAAGETFEDVQRLLGLSTKNNAATYQQMAMATMTRKRRAPQSQERPLTNFYSLVEKPED